MRSFLVLVAVRQACGECWGADVSSFTWCSGYADAGYSCNANMCAAESCKPWLKWMVDCIACAVHYPDATLHTASGRCCDRLSEDGSCEGPKDALTPKNEDYGFPDSNLGPMLLRPALNVDGAVAFPNGAPVWSADQPDGAYGFIWNTPNDADGAYGKKDADCPAFPDDVSFDASKVQPASLVQHGPDGAYEACFLSCDVSEIERTGVDPCAAGSRPDIGTKMACYWGGEAWLTPSTMGICAYPCVLRNLDKDFCSQADFDAGKCLEYCDPRRLDDAASPSQTIKIGHQNGSLLV